MRQIILVIVGLVSVWVAAATRETYHAAHYAAVFTAAYAAVELIRDGVRELLRR